MKRVRRTVADGQPRRRTPSAPCSSPGERCSSTASRGARRAAHRRLPARQRRQPRPPGPRPSRYHGRLANVRNHPRGRSGLDSAPMRRLIAAAAALLTFSIFGVAVSAAPISKADTDVQPAGSVPIPDGPAQAWIVADSTADRCWPAATRTSSTRPRARSRCCWRWWCSTSSSLNSTVVADVADTQVECNCVGVKPGRSYTTRELLDGLLLVSGNDAANTLAHMLGGPDVAVAKMNAKAASLGAASTQAATPVRPGRRPTAPGASTAHDLAVIFRAAMANPMFAQITAEPSAMFPGDPGERATNDPEPGRAVASVSRRDRRQDRASPTPPARRSSARPRAVVAGW